jgi:hypothetical protein
MLFFVVSWTCRKKSEFDHTSLRRDSKSFLVFWFVFKIQGVPRRSFENEILILRILFFFTVLS